MALGYRVLLVVVFLCVPTPTLATTPKRLARKSALKQIMGSLQKAALLRSPKTDSVMQVESSNSASGDAQNSGGDKNSNPEEQLEQWIDAGGNAVGLLSTSEVTSTANLISADSWCQNLKSFVSLTPERLTVDNGGMKAEHYIEQKMKALGLAVDVDNYHVSSSAIGDLGEIMANKDLAPNIIAVLKGTDLANETVLIASHYDSVNWENIKAGQAPGADDNGSGVASLLSVAQVLAARKTRPRRTIVFAALSGEEEGLWGSQHFVDTKVATGQMGELKAALILDQVGYAGRAGGSKDHKAILETTMPKTPEIEGLIDTMAHSVQRESSLKGLFVNWHGFGSDHIPFRKKGFPAALLIEADDEYYADHWAHSNRDTLEHIDCSFGGSMARVALRTMLQYAYPKAQMAS